jgi:prevent-host-death family protein
MSTVCLNEAKTHLSALISRVERTGVPITISRHRRLVAEIVPIRHRSRSVPDPELSSISIGYDPTEPTEAEWDDAE